MYWIPVYEILESHGLHVVLANARDARAVPGRKTDVNDAQWIQRLHACGLLRASFHPDREIAALRSYLRLRERHLNYAAAHIQHMQKALTHMNLQLQHVVADITGATGMRIIRAIVAGERNAATLATLRDTRCKSSVETIQSALVGNYQPEHVFALAQALAMYDAYQAQLEVCDHQIAQSLQRLSRKRPSPSEPLPKPRHRARQPNALNFDVRALLYQLVGVDLTQIHGIGPYLALRLVAECGTDLSRWRTAHHFTSWLTLAPGCRISGGKVLSAHTRKTKNRVTAHLRLAAVTIGRTNTALGAFYRRLSAVSARPRRSPPLRVRSPSCSTTPCASAWLIKIPVPITMSSGIASAWSKACTVGQPNLASHYRRSKVFLRKALTIFSQPTK